MHRMIFWELARVFILALLGLTGMLVMGGLMSEASQHGLGPVQLLEAIPLLIPSTLPYTLPATTLFATCVVYGRLAHDNEILALKSAGVHLWHVVWPAVLLGVLTSGATFVLSLDVIPTTHHELRTRFIKNVKALLYTTLKHEGSIRHTGKSPYTINVQRVQGDKLIEALFMRHVPNDDICDVIAWAREAELDVDLNQGELLVKMRHYYVSNYSGDDVGVLDDEREWRMPLPPDVKNVNEKRSARAMTWWEIRARIDKHELERQKMAEERALHQAEVNQGSAPVNYVQHIKDLTNALQHKDTDIRYLVTELHMRPALSLGCLCFVLVGCPVGIWFSRSDYLSAFITCFLPIVVFYYPLILCGINLAKLGKINPWLALWSANVLVAVVALALFRRLLRN
jgi:lipopolysaccharide export system permease protein